MSSPPVPITPASPPVKRKRGRPKGSGKGIPLGPRGPQARTIAKEEAREALRQIVLEEMRAMTRSQIHAATGISHFMLREKATGQWRRLTNWKEIESALNDPGAKDGSTYWIYTKDPSTPAYTDLMNRALDKPKEQAQEVTLSGDDALITALMAGRQYARTKRDLGGG